MQPRTRRLIFIFVTLMMTPLSRESSAQSITFERITTGLNGTPINGRSFSPKLSANGRYVLFSSNASNLVTGDLNPATDVFVYDRVTRVTTLESVRLRPSTQIASSWASDISADGRFIVFFSNDANLVEGVSGSHVYLRDRLLGTTALVSVSDLGAPGNGQSVHASVSDDGRFVTFWSTASNLVTTDTNGRATSLRETCSRAA